MVLLYYIMKAPLYQEVGSIEDHIRIWFENGKFRREDETVTVLLHIQSGHLLGYYSIAFLKSLCHLIGNEYVQ